MSLFQRPVIAHYAAATDKAKLDALYQCYSAQFCNSSKQANIRSAKEEQYQEGFLRDLFVDVLGYIINPNENWNLTTELKNTQNSKKADGAVIMNGTPKMVIELKGTNTKDLQSVEAQAFGYRNNHVGVRYIVISNFEKLRFYIDNAVEYEEFNLFTLSREEFTKLWLLLAAENIASDLPLTLRNKSVVKEQDVSEQLYRDYAACKRELFADMREHNPQYEPLLLFRKTQKLMDRLLFILFAEDRGLIPPNTISYINDAWQAFNEQQEEFGIGTQRPLYDFYKGIFNNLNKGTKTIYAYNGGLFRPDEVLDSICLSSEPLLRHTGVLTAYDFATEVDVDIMGHIFEHSLSEIEEMTAELTGGKRESSGKRNKDGIFYTPGYITRYMADITLGRLISQLRPAPPEPGPLKPREKSAAITTWEAYRTRLLSLTICDPACGSGAFLNAALQRLMEEHRLIDETLASLRGDSLILSDIENTILENNLYGVDINEESVEIAKLSLWLRTAQKGRKLSTLSQNIKVGNSLISDPQHAPHNAFDWQQNFPQVFARGGFDIIIGNPPYVALQTMTQESATYAKLGYESFDKNGDLYCLFTERAYSLLRPGGLLSFIMPNKWMLTDYGKGLRAFMSRTGLRQIINFGDVQFFKDATTYVCIFLTENAPPAPTVQALSLNRKTYHGDFLTEIPAGLSPFPATDFGAEPWSIRPPEHTAKLHQMSTCKQLREFNISINRGVLTGLNEAFFIDTATRNAILERDPRSAELLKPMLRGRDIAAWSNRGEQLWLINTHNGIPNQNLAPVNVEEYPAIKKHLDQYWEKLAKRTDKGITPYNLRSCVYLQQFSQPKIIYPNMTSIFPFMYDEEGHYINDKAFMLSSTEQDRELMLALTALFNSAAAKLWIWYNCPELQGGTREIRKVYFEKFPVPEFGEHKHELAELAEKRTETEKAHRKQAKRFLHRLCSDFPGTKISAKLAEFWHLEFSAFLKEAKLRLKPADKDDWEEYFCTTCSKLQALHLTAATLEQQIDATVWQLYGVSDC